MSNLIIEAGKYYLSRDGRQVHVVAIRDDMAQLFPVLGYFTGLSGFSAWTADGGRGNLSGPNDSLDLIEEWVEPLGGTVWVNVYENDELYTHHSREAADRCCKNNQTRLACIEVNWKEGEGL